jgi:hypothetical protein
MTDFGSLFCVDVESPSGLAYKTLKLRSSRHWRKHGDPAGVKDSFGYWRVYALGRSQQVHRIVYALHHGIEPAGDIDHIDRDTANNLIENLRDVPPVLNARNRSRQRRNSSGATGVDRFSASGYDYWRARWYDAAGVARTKSMAILKHGEEKAFAMACAARAEAIALVGGYTLSHGV